MRTAVLVHGAWHGGWCWDALVPELEARGVRAVAVDLPLTTLADDADTAAAAVSEAAAAGGEVVLVGHSYGGAVITEAGDRGGVTRLVYVAALVPDHDDAGLGLAGGGITSTLSQAVRAGDDGTISVAEEARVAAFYADCDPAAATESASRLRPMQAAPFTATVTATAWRTVPSTYVVCTRDQAMDAETQRHFAARCTDSVTFDSGHSPFLSMPVALAEVIATA